MLDTLPALFFNTSRKYSDRVALRFKTRGEFSGSVTWKQWSESVFLTAQGMHLLGIKHGDRVGILSENCPEWTFVDLGTLSLGAVVVPLYPTLSEADLAFIIENSGMSLIFVSTPEQFKKVSSLQGKLNNLKIVTFYQNESSLSLNALQHQAKSDDLVRSVSLMQTKVQASDLATIIYTSGTTGVPKGVMLTHDNFVENFRGASERIHISDQDVALSFLPLSHVFERLAGYYFMAFSGAQIVYAESMQTVAEDIKQICPTVAAAVPRFYEKVYAAIQAKLQKAGPISQFIFKTAISFRKKNQSQLKKAGSHYLHLIDSIFDKLVYSKVRQGVGGKIRFFISGGAPLSRELAEFFDLCGVLILEGYGLTETSPVIACNTESEFRFGTVGKVLPNVKVKIAEDGEILTSGRCVMRGYFENSEATAEVLQDGWFHTGDIGELDGDGYLKITDRKKDLIVTAGGKKVAPQKLEAMVMRDTLFSQVVALGDKRPYIIALVVLNRAIAAEQARALGLDETSSVEAWACSAEFSSWVLARVHKQTEELARFESIKSIAILPAEFSIANGELTPTLKVKRKFVMEKYRSLIDKLYATE